MLTIHPDLKSLIPPLTDTECQQLEQNLLEGGCRDPLVVWQEEQTLLDGHHRLEICERHGLTYDVHEVSLPDLDAAKLWMIAHQLGRRNLTPEQMSYLRGKQYEFRKGSRGGDRKSKGKTYPLEDTASTLAAEHKVSAKTIKNDAAFARAVDHIAAAVGGEEGQGVRQAILARETKVTHDDVKVLAAVATQDAAMARDALAAVQEAPTPRQAQQIVRAAIRKVQPAPQVLILEPETEEPDEVPGAALPCTGDYEWYTPADLMARVRAVLGGIDLDPASCAMAQQTVQARTFYSAQDDGLRQPWPGTVFLNPPYKLPDVARFVGKLLDEREAGRTTAAILCVNNATHTDWFQSIGPRADAICFLDGKRAFTHATHDGLSPISGHAFLYFGPQVARFCEVFGVEGFLVTPLAARVSPQLPLAAAAPRARPAVTPGTVEGDLLAAFQAHAPAGYRPKEAASAIGKPGGNVSGALQTLCYKGYLRKEGAAYVLAWPPVAEGAV